MHLIPKDQSLWEMDRLEQFVEARRELNRQTLRKIGVVAVSPSPSVDAVAVG
jgi:hypothetical protein